MRQVMAVYDVDPFYAARFSEVVNQKSKIPFEVMAFSSIERLLSYGKEAQIQLLLVGSQVDAKELKGLGIKKIITLSDGENLGSATEYPSVYKYQSSDNIIREVMACYCDGEEDTAAPLKSGASIIGVYSPVGRCRKTSFALTMGLLLSREGRTLYITLEEYSCLQTLIGGEFREDLSDLMYYFGQGNHNGLRLNSVVHSAGGLDYIPPARYPEDLAHMSPRQMADMVSWVAAEGGYQSVIVDVGNYGRRVFPILDVCGIIYMPSREDSVSKAKIDAFYKHMECAGQTGLRDKIKTLRLPRGDVGEKAGTYPEQLLWGELGDYVRQLLKGGQYK